jgi:hypothetical protein
VQTENEKAVRTLFEKLDFELYKGTYESPMYQTVRVPMIGIQYLNSSVQKRYETFLLGYNAALQSQVSNTDGWIDWPGGGCPVTPDELVEVEYRSATPNFPATRSWPNNAREFYWEHLNGPNDIVRYRVVSAAPKAPQQVLNTPQDAIGYVMENYAEFYAKHGQTVMTPEPESGRIPVYATPPQQEQSGEAVDVEFLQAALDAAIKDANHYRAMAEASIQGAVNRFLGWKLPADFAPDCGISFKRESDYEHPEFGRTKYEPIGTNLFHAEQAKAMFEYCLAGSTSPATPTATASQESAPTSDQTGREPT